MYRTTAPNPPPATAAATAGSRWTTREIAALDFLLNIPLEAEESIVRAGLSGGGGGETTATEKESDGIPVGGDTVLSAIRVVNSANNAENTTGGTTTRWWEKLRGEIPEHERRRRKRLELEDKELERPESKEQTTTVDDQDIMGSDGYEQPLSSKQGANATTPTAAPLVAPGRRLDGNEATCIKIPRETHNVEMVTSHRTIARQAAIREWEIRVAQGLRPSGERSGQAKDIERFSRDQEDEPRGLLDGRAFLSSHFSYPAGVFSVIKYEPRKEEAARRRKKLEERGGGGTQFVMPERDWRGISYRALLPRVHKKNRAFNRTLRKARMREKRGQRKSSVGETSLFASAVEVSDESHAEDDVNDLVSDSDMENNDTVSVTSSSSEESDGYVPGFLDDPEIRQGRHRHVMVGDRVTGCIVTSTIQFVKPVDLKADLNKQFKDRFDGWEPPKNQRTFIGAKIVDGVYTLCDPTEFPEQNYARKSEEGKGNRHRRKGSMSDLETIRMPPSLTLSKIRRLKQQALVACIKARLEVSTVAVACVYFERLALDCRVDKSNRKLVFATCLLLACKINEKNVAMVHDDQILSEGAETKMGMLQSFIRPTKIAKTQFASLFEFFSHEWSVSLKSLFSAEWGVFAALGFNLQAKPSHVAFHFKRFMKVLEWNSMAYLGQEQFNQWQKSLDDENKIREKHYQRRRLRREQEERKLLLIQHDYHKQQQTEGAARQQRRSSQDGSSDSYSSNSASAASRDNSIPDTQNIGKSDAASSPPYNRSLIIDNLRHKSSNGAKGSLGVKSKRRATAGGMRLWRFGPSPRPVTTSTSVVGLDKMERMDSHIMKRSVSSPDVSQGFLPPPRMLNPRDTIDMQAIDEIKKSKSEGEDGLDEDGHRDGLFYSDHSIRSLEQG